MKLILLLLISLTYTPLLFAATPPGEVPISGTLRNEFMQGLTGPPIMLSSYQGKPLLINVWASYCGPCLAEMRSIEALHQRYNTQFNVIGVSIDDYPIRANAFLAKANTTFMHYIDHKLILETMFGAQSIPLTLLVDAQGRILAKVKGAREWDSPEIIQAIGETFEMSM